MINPNNESAQSIQPLRMPDLPDCAGDSFREDLSHFVQATGHIVRGLSAEIVDSPAPDLRSRGNVRASPPSASLMQLEAAKDKGYSVVYGRYDAEPRGIVEPVDVGVLAAPSDIEAINKLLYTSASPEGRSYGNLLSRVADDGLGHYHFVPGHDARNRLLTAMAALPKDEVDMLSRRGFLANQLYNSENALHLVTHSNIGHIIVQNLRLYERFREEGVVPLGFEELYGIASKIVSLELEANPDIAPPAAHEPHDFEEF